MIIPNLVSKLNCQEQRVLELKKYGMSSDVKTMKSVRKRRNDTRKELLELLIKWKNGEIQENITFDDLNKQMKEI